MKYCVECKYFSTKVKGHNKEGFDGSCILVKKNIYETSRACKDFKEDLF